MEQVKERAIQARQELFKDVQQMYSDWTDHVLVKSCTGSGKCKMALDLLENRLKKGEQLDIIVPQVKNIQTWNIEINKWGYDRYAENIDIYCDDSLHKHSRECNVIYDEAHMITELKLSHVKPKCYIGKAVIGLTATVDEGKLPFLKELGLGKHNSVPYPLDQGVKDTIVCPYHVTAVFVPLSTQKNIEIKARKGYTFKVSEGDQYSYSTGNIESLEKLYKDVYAMHYMHTRLPDWQKDGKIISKLKEEMEDYKSQLKTQRLFRMRTIHNLPSKLLAGQYILGLVPPHLKLMGFCANIKQCNALFNHRYHSKTDDTDYDSFVANKISRLGVVNAANVGINIKDMVVALITQVQMKDIHLLQRIGRMVRLNESDPDKVAEIIVVISEGTQDEVWFEDAIRSLDESNITRMSFGELIDKGLPRLQKL